MDFIKIIFKKIYKKINIKTPKILKIITFTELEKSNTVIEIDNNTEVNFENYNGYGQFILLD